MEPTELKMSPAQKSAIEFLESLQKEYWRPYLTSESRERALSREADRINKELGFPEEIKGQFEANRARIKGQIFSRFEPFETFALLSHLMAEIEPVVEKFEDLKNTKKILFGSLGTGDVNGVAINFDNPEYFIVLIDDGVFGFANLLTKAIALSFPQKPEANNQLRFSTEIGDIESHLQANSEASQRFVELYLAYILDGNPLAAPPYLLGRDYISFVSAWRDTMEFFILAHEFGHVHLGHLNSNLRGLITRRGYEEIPASWQQEFEADFFGLVVALTCMGARGFSPSLTYVGIEMFFLGIAALENSLARLGGYQFCDDGSATHPASITRRIALREFLSSILSKDEKNGALHLVSIVERIFDLMNQNLNKKIDFLIGQNIKAHQKWSR